RLDPSAPVSPTNLPGTSLQLLYSSLAAYPVVTFIYRYQLDPTRPVPPTIHAALTLNGTTGNTVWYNTALLNPGDIVEIPLQGDATALATGRYSWSISVTADYLPTPVTTSQSGSVNIINENGSLFGAGWTLVGFDRIWPVTGGVILEQAGGR